MYQYKTFIQFKIYDSTVNISSHHISKVAKDLTISLRSLKSNQTLHGDKAMQHISLYYIVNR